jgi:hypothetical protein
LASGEWCRWNLNLKFPVVFTLVDDAHAIEAGIEVLKIRRACKEANSTASDRNEGVGFALRR